MAGEPVSGSSSTREKCERSSAGKLKEGRPVSTPSTKGLRRILCATDLTPRSTSAVRRAGSLARQTGARLTLLHVINSRQPDRVARMQANRAYVELLSQADRAFGSAAGFIDVVVRRGEPRDIIANAAHEWDADLIVVAAPQ